MTVNAREQFLAYGKEMGPKVLSRPLMRFSNLAVNLSRHTDGSRLAYVAEERLLDIPFERIMGMMSESDMAVARLDVQLVANTIHHRGAQPGPVTRSAVEIFAELTGKPPTLTFSDLIDANPRGDLRTATGSADEEAFIAAHQISEVHFDTAVEHIDSALTSLDEGESRVAEVLSGANDELSKIVEVLGVFARGMSTEDFLKFRDFYRPLRPELKGASAQFSPGLPTIDELLNGQKPPPEYRRYIDGNLDYYPESARSRILTARDRAISGRSLRALTEFDEMWRDVRAQVDLASRIKDRIRLVHIAMAKEHMPNITHGTSGDGDPIRFLEMIYEWTRDM